jgi:hypothetical protein
VAAAACCAREEFGSGTEMRQYDLERRSFFVTVKFGGNISSDTLLIYSCGNLQDPGFHQGRCGLRTLYIGFCDFLVSVQSPYGIQSVAIWYPVSHHMVSSQSPCGIHSVSIQYPFSIHSVFIITSLSTDREFMSIDSRLLHMLSKLASTLL